jgi:hypothetical protein
MTRIAVADARARLEEAGVFDRLVAFDPRWIGSIPLDVHHPGADADICCTAPDLPRFRATLDQAFGHRDGYRSKLNTHAGEASVIAYFDLGGLPVEIYGRERPVECHEGYVHWLAADRLLRLAEERLREDVRAAKGAGRKTEPAFAHCLKLGGDPFAEMLKLASPPDAALRAMIRRAGYALA